MRILRWIGIAIVALMGIAIAALVVVVALGVSFSLDAFRGDIEAAAKAALGRVVEIEGPLTLVLALHPTVEVRSLRIANPPGWDKEAFSQLDRARVTVELLPLLRREISIDEIAIEGIDARLEVRVDGTTNWKFEREPFKAPTDANGGSGYEFVRLGELAVRSLTVNYHDAGSGQTHEAEIEALDGSVERDGPMVFSARGMLRNQPLDVSVTGGSLVALSDPAQPWSLDVTAKAADAVVTLRGRISDPVRAQGVDLDIRISGDRLESVESLTGLSIPPVGPYAVEARFVRSETEYRLSDLEGSIGNSSLIGSFVLGDLAGRPRLTGALNIAVLDVEPFLTGDSQPLMEASEVVGSSHDTKEQVALLDFSLDAAAHALQSLQNFDADVTLNVDRVMGEGADIRDASLRAKLAGGKLTAPIAATIEDVPLAGQLAIQSSDDTLDMVMELSSSGSDIRKLTRTVKVPEDFKGGFQQFNLRASGRGRDLRAALESLDVLVTMGLADLTYAQEGVDESVSLKLEDFELVLPQGQPLRVATRGSLLGEAFSLDLTSATMSEVLSDAPWPIDLSASGAGARLSLKGSVPEPGGFQGTTLDMDLSGNRIGDLAVWVGSAPKSQAAYGVRGTLFFGEDKATIESLRVSLGQTVVTGNLSASQEDQNILLGARLRSSVIDPAELATLFPQQEKPDGSVDDPGLNLYMPILPYGVTIVAADLDLAVERVRLQPVDVTNLTFNGQFRDGHLKPSPVTARIGEVPFTGRLSFDLRSQMPEATVNIRSQDVDVGSLLRDFRIVETSETKARRLELDMIVRGNTLRTAIQESEISVVVEDGMMVVRDPNTQTPLEIRIIKSTLSSSPGKPIAYIIDGRIEAVPAKIRIETDPLASFLESSDRVPLRLTASAAGAEVEMNGSISRPLALRNFVFDFSVEGDRLDSVDELLQVSAPPWGPYALGGKLRLDRIGYHAPELMVQVGDSHLTGSVSLDTTGARPRLTVNLEGRTLQLNDFRTDEWSAFENDEPAEEPGKKENRSKTVARNKAQVEALFTSESMRGLDARLSLVVNEVWSGVDRLGSGHLVAILENGRLSVDPLTVEIPGGSADARFSFEMTETDVTAQTNVSIERLDYGVLARRIDPAARNAGWLSLDADLQSRSENLETMMSGASGHFDFAVWPKDMQADIFDLWAANLLLAILPRLDSGSRPVVNCVVGVFDMTDGVMKPKRLLIDTTNVQVSGNGEIDLNTQQMDITLAPRAKRPTMFGHATPIRFRGSYSDLQAGVSPDELVRSAARFVTSIFAPIQQLFTTSIPTDGEAACLAAMDRSSQ